MAGLLPTGADGSLPAVVLSHCSVLNVLVICTLWFYLHLLKAQ